MSRVSRVSRRGLVGLTLSMMLVALALPTMAPWRAGGAQVAAAAASSATQRAAIQSNYGQLPLSFELNQGQAASSVRFLAHGSGYALALTPGEALLALQSPPATSAQSSRFRLPGQPAITARTSPQQPPSVVGMQWLGANPNPVVTGEDALPGTVNYFIGNDPSRWHTNIPTYQQVRLHDVYPGVDLVYYGTNGQLEYDFVVAPGADPAHISLGFTGAQAMGVDLQGNLRLVLPDGALQEDKPLVYQTVNGARQTIAGGYTLAGGQRTGFTLGAYNPRLPLVIDPLYRYSTYLGGNDFDGALGIAVDAAGNAYVVGQTGSLNFPLANALYGTCQCGHYSDDGFVSKLNAAGTALVYSTYLGGNSEDGPSGVAVDSSGNAYVGGFTRSTNFPVINALQPTFGGAADNPDYGGDGFVSKLNATGSALIYSTYLGGSNSDSVSRIAADNAGDAYVGGMTSSTDFPIANAFQAVNHGSSTYGDDGFVSKIDPSGTFVYSTYLGGSDEDNVADIAADSAGNAYVTGGTSSADFPTTAGSYQPNLVGHGSTNAFITKLNASGSALVYSTFLGGSVSNAPPDYTGNDAAYAIAIDSSGNAYVTGAAGSTNFPLVNPLQSSASGATTMFVSKLSADGSTLVYSTYFGGSAGGYSRAIAVDSAGNAYLTGAAWPGFPTVDPLQAQFGGSDANPFVFVINAAETSVLYASYLDGTSTLLDEGYGIALGPGGDVYVAGQTTATDFPVHNALQSTYGGGGNDAFVAKMMVRATPTTTTGVFRPSNGVLYLKNANTTGPADITLYYGKPGDQPITGDWTGKGYKSIGVYRNGTFYLRNSNTTGFADITVPFGNSSDIPVAGDWTGKGYDSIGVYNPSTNTFLLRNSNTAGPADITARLGISGDVPIVGDWTGKGWDSIGVFRPSNGIVYLRNSNTTGVANINFVYGIAGDKPVVGDWNADGVDTIGVDRNGNFLLRNSNTTGPANASFYLGVSGDDPIAGPWVAPASSPPPVRRGPSGSGTHTPARAPAAQQSAGATLPRPRARMN